MRDDSVGGRAPPRGWLIEADFRVFVRAGDNKRIEFVSTAKHSRNQLYLNPSDKFDI